jgi:exopolysaccharide biosynthesis polyprenyl glycosylphosphotransferase
MSATTHVTELPGRSKPSARGNELSWGEEIASNWSTLTWVLLDSLVVAISGTFVLLLFGSRINRGSWDLGAGLALPNTNLRVYLGALLIYSSLAIFACAGAEIYNPRTALMHSRVRTLAKPLGVAAVVFSVFIWCLNASVLCWMMTVTFATLDFLGAIAWRRLQDELALSRAASGLGVRRALIVGAGQSGKELALYLKANALLGYSVVGFLDEENTPEVDVLGSLNQLSQVVQSQFIDDVFVSGAIDPFLLGKLRDEAALCRVNLQMVPGISHYTGPWRYIGNLPVNVLRYQPIPRIGLFFKRVLDVTGAALGLILSLPLFCIVAVLICLDSPGPVFYRAARVGKRGWRFKCLKFRTMRADADAVKAQLRLQNQRCGPTFKIEHDPRITRLGKYLRTYSIDELPQLWNVLIGDMSLVGPRPHPLDDYERYELDHRVRLSVTPGVTGLWQITARSDPSFERNMQLDLEYIRNWSFWGDLKILLGTIPAVIRGEGV